MKAGEVGTTGAVFMEVEGGGARFAGDEVWWDGRTFYASTYTLDCDSRLPK